MLPTAFTERQLVQSLQAGQAAAFAHLYTAYGPTLQRVLLRLVNDPVVAEDLLQDAFLKIWTTFHRYDAQQSRLFTWLVTVTRNIALDELSRRKRQVRIYAYVHHCTEQLAHIAATDVMAHQSLFERVAPKYRPILELTHQGYTKEEIAHQCKLPIGTVKTRYRMAMQALKRYYNQDIDQYRAQ